MEPEEVTRPVAERLNAGDAAGDAALYEPEAVLAYPATGRRRAARPSRALTSTRSADNTGVRVQVLRRQPDGSWLRIIDRPEVPQP
jgi:hypothetical protein